MAGSDRMTGVCVMHVYNIIDVSAVTYVSDSFIEELRTS